MTFTSYSCHKQELLNVADRLLQDDPIAVEWCVSFIEVETIGIWHGRARAKMSRRLKHCHLTNAQKDRVVQAVLNRLLQGFFAEQFKDQLYLALLLNPDRVRTVAAGCKQ